MTGPSFPDIEAALQRILRPLPDAFRELAQDEARTNEARQDFHAAAEALDRALRHLADSRSKTASASGSDKPGHLSRSIIGVRALVVRR